MKNSIFDILVFLYLVEFACAFQLLTPISRIQCKRSLGVANAVEHIDLSDSGEKHDESLLLDRQSFLGKSSTFLLLGSTLSNHPLAAFASESTPSEAAIYAYRSAGLPSLRPLGLAKLLTRYEGFVQAPNGYYKRDIPISFDFPSDWLQLDKLGGGLQFVDQRNGDKLYVLRATLPPGADLKSVSKSWFGDSIFNPEGDVIRSGVVVDGYRVTRSSTLVDCEDGGSGCVPRRRLLLKYDTVTGSGVQTVERRGLVDAHQIGGDVYMMVTASNAVKFEAKGSKERETVENIVDSFRIG